MDPEPTMFRGRPAADPVDEYLRQIAEIPGLSPEEEKVLVDEIDALRIRFQAILFGSGVALDRAVEVLTTVCQDPAGIGRFFQQADSSARKSELTTPVETLLRRIQWLLDASRNRLARIWNESTNGTRPDPRRIRADLRSRFEEPALELARMRLHGNIVDSIASSVFRSEQRLLAPIAEDDVIAIQLETLNTPEGVLLARKDLDEARSLYEDRKNLLCTHHLPAVVSIARKHASRRLPLPDLIQEGSAGLMQAADRYLPSPDLAFSDFCRSWIQTAIRQSSSRSRLIRLPSGTAKLLRKLNRYRSDFFQDRDRDPTLEELADALGVPESEIQLLDRLDGDLVSLDEPVDRDEMHTLGDLLEDPKGKAPGASLDDEKLTDRLEGLLQDLSIREKSVLRLRYGLGNGREHTLEEVARILRVSKTRVRKLQSNAFRKLTGLAGRLHRSS